MSNSFKFDEKTIRTIAIDNGNNLNRYFLLKRNIIVEPRFTLTSAYVSFGFRDFFAKNFARFTLIALVYVNFSLKISSALSVKKVNLAAIESNS